MKALRFYKKNDMRLEDIPEPSPKKARSRLKFRTPEYVGQITRNSYTDLYGSRKTPHIL